MGVKSFQKERPGFLLHVIERHGNLTAGLFILRNDALITFRSTGHLAEFAWILQKKARDPATESARSEHFDIFHIKERHKYLIECFVRASFQVTVLEDEFAHLCHLFNDLCEAVRLVWCPPATVELS